MRPYRIVVLLLGVLFLVACVHGAKNTNIQQNTESQATTGSHIRNKRSKKRVGNVIKPGVRVIEKEELERTGETDLGRAIKKVIPGAR